MLRCRTTFAAAPLLALACCAAPPPKPAPAPLPAAPAAPPPAPVLSVDWRDWPLTPGRWTYRDGAARFGTGDAAELVVRCEAAARLVTLARAATPMAGQRSVQITTSDAVRAFPVVDRPEGATVSFQAADRFLDAMAFSRGRIVVAVAGTPRLVVPAWAEIGRVVEDCRG